MSQVERVADSATENLDLANMAAFFRANEASLKVSEESSF